MKTWNDYKKHVRSVDPEIAKDIDEFEDNHITLEAVKEIQDFKEKKTNLKAYSNVEDMFEEILK